MSLRELTRQVHGVPRRRFEFKHHRDQKHALGLMVRWETGPSGRTYTARESGRECYDIHVRVARLDAEIGKHHLSWSVWWIGQLVTRRDVRNARQRQIEREIRENPHRYRRSAA